MLLKNEIKVNEVYAYDIDSMCISINKPTKTVKLLEVNDSGLLLVECQQTSNLINCGSHMLTTIDRARKILEGYKLAVIKEDESDIEMYSYNKTIKRLEEILLRYDLDNTLIV